MLASRLAAAAADRDDLRRRLDAAAAFETGAAGLRDAVMHAQVNSGNPEP